MRIKTPSDHPFLPPDSERSAVITALSRFASDPTKYPRSFDVCKDHNVSVRATRCGSALRVVYTPSHATNMQSSDVVNIHPSSVLSALRTTLA